MARQYTAQALIDVVKRKASVPGTAATGTADADILDHINECLLTEMVPWLMKFREEYLVVSEQIPLVSGTSRYRINPRAVGQQLRDVLLIGSGTSNRRPIGRIQREDLPLYDQSGAYGGYEGFYIEGNDVVLVSTNITSAASLELSFYFRPGELVIHPTSAVTVTVVDTATKTVDFAGTIPSGWDDTLKYDIHSGYSGAEIKVWGLTAATVNANDIVFSDEIDGSVVGTKAVEVGDYLCLEEEAALPALPRECHPILAQSAVCSVLRAAGDIELLDRETQQLNRMMKRAESFTERRVKGKPQKVTGNRSPLWQGSQAGSSTYH